jgi:hypothetical protein
VITKADPRIPSAPICEICGCNGLWIGCLGLHPQILQMDTDREVEGGGWKALVPVRSGSRHGQFGDRHSCRWNRTASQTLWIHPGTQSKRRATSTGHRRPAPTPKDNRRNPSIPSRLEPVSLQDLPTSAILPDTTIGETQLEESPDSLGAPGPFKQ